MVNDIFRQQTMFPLCRAYCSIRDILLLLFEMKEKKVQDNLLVHSTAYVLPYLWDGVFCLVLRTVNTCMM